MNGLDIKSLMKMLSGMNKDEIEKGIKQAKTILENQSSDEIIKNIQKEKK